MSEIKLETTAFEALVQKAILDTRDQVILQALEWLIKPGRGDYRGAEPSPLTQAFRSAVSASAQAVAKEYILDNPDLRSTLRQMLDEAMASALEEGGELRREMIGQMASVISQAFDKAAGYR